MPGGLHSSRGPFLFGAAVYKTIPLWRTCVARAEEHWVFLSCHSEPVGVATHLANITGPACSGGLTCALSMQKSGPTFEKGYFSSKEQGFVRSMKLQLKVGACTMRAAFSHIPFWQSTIRMGQQIVMQPCQGNIATGGSVVEQMDQVLPAAPSCMFLFQSAVLCASCTSAIVYIYTQIIYILYYLCCVRLD